MLFVRPSILWLLLLVVPLAWLHWRSRIAAGRGQALGVAIVRLTALALLIAALARPVIDASDPVRTTVAVVDLSASIDDADLDQVGGELAKLIQGAARDSEIRLVVFDRVPREVPITNALRSPGGLAALRKVDSDGDVVARTQSTGSALADALILAGALIRHDGRGRVVLYSDGQETNGDARSAAFRLGQRGLAISVTPLGRPRDGEVVLRSVSAPPQAGVGATVLICAQVEASEPMRARLVVSGQSGADEIVSSVELRAGLQTVTARCPLRAEGIAQLTARLESDVDTNRQNNSLPVAIRVMPPREVHVVEDGQDRSAAGGLAAMLGPSANVKAIDAAALRRSASLADVDLLVLADVTAEAISQAGMNVIRDAVADGMGLLVTGGRRSFGPGGYANTPLAHALPVRFAQQVERRDPSTTLVVIIDTSGSMGGARVNLAKEIARLALRRLKPHDKAGVVEFYGSKRWAAPIQPASNAIDLQRALNRLTAGGGTVILPAIEEAYYALLNVRTRTRHVLVLTDGGVETGAFEPLIRKMADRGMTLSTVLVGPGAQSAFLARLAQWGRGKSYHAPDRFNLPEVIVKQPESSLLSPFVEQPTALVPSEGLAVLEGIDFARAPKITGYVETQLRPTAELIVRSPSGHPILATWQYGLGKVATLTTHLSGDWSAELARWPDYGKLISNVARSLFGVTPATALDVVPQISPAGLEVRVMARAGSNAAAFDAIDLAVSDAMGNVHERRRLDPIRAYEWNARFANLPEGVVRLDARTTGGKGGSAAVALPPIREVYRLGPDVDGLNEIQAVSRRAASQAAASTQTPTRPEEIWPILAALGLALFLLNVLIRRLPMGVLRRRGGSVAVPVLLLGLSFPAGRASAQTTASKPIAATTAATLPGSPLDAIGRAREARRHGDTALAHKTLIALTKVAGAPIEVWAELAGVCELLGKDADALQALDKAFAAERAPDTRFALLIRKAQLLYDAGKQDAARRALRDVIELGDRATPARTYCAHVAALCGDAHLAAELLKPAGKGKRGFHEHLFRGAYLLRENRPAEAGTEFEQAHALAPLSRDRRYALQRILTAARQAQTLEKLADRWVADASLSPGRMRALVGILGEMGRSADALALLQRKAMTPEQRSLVESAEFQREVIAVAIDAGQIDQAEAAYRALVAREPRQVSYRVGLARLLLINGRRSEAEALFHQGLDQVTASKDLMALAEGACTLALDDVALAAAQKAGQANDGAQVRSILFEADLARQRGEPDRALALLGRLKPLADRDAKVLLPAAEAFERYGNRAEAVRLLKRLYERTRSEDVLLRVAWLVEEDEQLDQAYRLWKELWQQTEVQARWDQAQVRLLDLAARTGKLADLAIELEERLDEGKGGQHELSLLVDIYTGANDPVSAAEILVEFGRRSGNQVETLERLAKVYLDCEQFGRCNAILRRLVELNPADADEYLQQIAIVALERRQPVQAKAALAELAAHEKAGGVAEEFSAGVLDMIGLHDESARAYDRVLARHPDRIEVFLLWGNAMKAAGQIDAAIGRFQALVETAEEDDLFTVAVDGLLNLNARPPALRSALRRVRERIALRPDKVFLYRLAADLLEAMGQTDRMTDVLAQAVIVAGERRGALLRELMDGASANGRTDDVIRFGCTLMALEEEVPPQVFLDLGEALIKEGQLASAASVFHRAGIHGDYAAIQQRVAGYYEQADMPERADRIIRDLLIGLPDNVQLLIRSGGLGEQMGRFDAAFERYEHAADLMLRRLPTFIRTDEPKLPETAEARKRQVRRRAMNLDEMTQYFESAGNGLLNAARTQTLQGRLVHQIEGRTTEELESLTAQNRLMPTLKQNPRLDSLATFLRYVAFALHVPDVADRIDQKLLAAYPRDSGLRSALVEARLEWGLTERAVAMADGVGQGTSVAPIRVARLLAEPKTFEAVLANGKATPADLQRMIPLLIMTGQEDLARKAVAALMPKLTTPMDDVAGTLFAAGVALDDPSTIRTWLRKSLDACRAVRGGDAVVKHVERIVGVAWGLMGAEDRAALTPHLAALAEAAKGSDRLKIDLLRMRLAKASAGTFPDQAKVFHDASKDATLPVEVQADVLATAATRDRPAMLEAMAAARKPAARRQLLLELVGALATPTDDTLNATVERLFKASPRFRLSPDRAYSILGGQKWNRNPNQVGLGLKLGEVLLGEQPEDPAIMTLVAVARHNAGKHGGAMLLASEVVEAITGLKELNYSHQQMLTDLGEIMSGEDLDAVIDDLRTRQEIEGATSTLMSVQGLLLSAGGRQAKAIDAFREAFKLAPDEMSTSRRLIREMEDAGRSIELADVLAAHLTKSTIMQSLQWRTVARIYADNHNLGRAMWAARRITSPLAPIEIMRVASMMGDSRRVLTVLRRFLIDNRSERRFYSPFWPEAPSPGGMEGFLAQPAGPRIDRDRIFAALAPEKFATEEFTSLLQSALPGRHDVEGLAQGVLGAAERRGARDALIKRIVETQQRGALNGKDQTLLLLLGRADPKAVPKALGPSLHRMLVHADPKDSQTLATLAGVALAHGKADRARSILRWAIAWDLLGTGGSSRVSERFERIDAYVGALPEPDRKAELLKILRRIQPSPLTRLTDAAESARLLRLARVADAAELNREVESLRPRVSRSSIGGLRQLCATIARLDAEAGRLDRFKEMTGRLVAAGPDLRMLRTVFDWREALPSAKNMKDPQAYVRAIVEQLVAAREKVRLRAADPVPAMCLLGRWCLDNGLEGEATELLRRATELAGDTKGRWLWVADLARAAGQKQQAAEIEVRLLKSRRLPVMRVPRLLEAVEVQKGQTEADALAVLVAAYTDHPTVLKRAIRQARREGKDDAAKSYEARLKSLSS